MAFDLTNWAFATSQTDYECSLIPYRCTPPFSACARDPQSARSFCCDYGGVCWNDVAACASNNSTFTCQRNGYTWCCVNGREQCDPTRDNACLSTLSNLFSEIPESVRNQTYSSLTAAAPAATYLSFSPSALVAAAQTTSSSSSTGPSGATAASNTASVVGGSSSPTSTGTTDHHAGLSGGAIGGIVAGVVVGLIIVGAGVWFCTKRSTRTKTQTQMPYHGQPDAVYTSGPEKEGYATYPQELHANNPPAKEMQASSVMRHELPAR